MKIVSIDPSMNGVTGVIVAKYDYMEDEPIILTNFAQIDFRSHDETNSEIIKENRYKNLELLIDFVISEHPNVVILENFIMFKKAMGEYGRSFITSEMIGALDLAFRREKIPVIKPRSSDLKNWDGYGRSQIKYQVTTDALMSRGFLTKVAHGRHALVIQDRKYVLKDIQIGSKSDHIIMAIKHLINEVDLKRPDIFQKVDHIKRCRFNREDE